MFKVNARITDDLKTKLDNLILEMESKATPGMEVNLSSIVRSSLEQFLERKEKEKKNIFNMEVPLYDLNDHEQDILRKALDEVYKSKLERVVVSNPKIKECNSEYYKEMNDFYSIEYMSMEILGNQIKQLAKGVEDYERGIQ